MRIVELRKTISLVSELIAATRLDDSPPLHRPGSSTATSATISPALLNGGLQYPSPPRAPQSESSPPHLTDANAMDVHGLDSIDLSRKRCASAVTATDGDRVVKAMKREPQPVKIPSPPPAGLASSILPEAKPSPPRMFPFNPGDGVPSFGHSASVSPPSAIHGTNIVDLTDTASESDFGSTSPTFPGTSWPGRPHSLQHRHTLSGGAVLNGMGGMHHHSMGMPGSSNVPLPFTAAGSFGHAPISLHPQLQRQTRSMSHNAGGPSPFAFGVPDSGSSSGSARHSFQDITRPSTSGGRETRHSSQEAVESDSEDDHSPSMSQSASRDQSRSRPRAGQSSRPSTSHGLSVDGSLGNLNHGNEVPQEYRGEVDRIFFEFLNRICSDRESTCRIPSISTNNHVY